MDVQITVASKVAAAPGKKQGKITDTTGKTWQVWMNKFHDFNEGGSYLIKKIKTNEFNGMTFNTIEEFAPIGGAAQAALPLSNGGRGPAASAAAPYRAEQIQPKIDNERRMDIFICGAFNNIMANPNVNPLTMGGADMVAVVEQLRKVWSNTLGPGHPASAQKAVVQNEDLNDRIPF